jgi:dipeptidyl aminopeptidase/acylaminoacyl peptidase
MNRFSPLAVVSLSSALSLIAPLILLVLIALQGMPLQAQQLPDTDIFLADVTLTTSSKGTSIKIGKTTNITNRAGYDNQPAFTPDGKFVLYTSIRADNQADIYRYSLREGISGRVTTTPESEYSPAITPDGKSISVVRVERDSTQRLWKFDLRGMNPQLVLDSIRRVGYYAWLDKTKLMLFIIGENGTPPMLQTADTRTGRAEFAHKDIGRSLAAIPGQSKGRRIGSFTYKLSEETSMISAFDADTKSASPVADVIAGSEDFAWTTAPTLLMARGTKLYHRAVKTITGGTSGSMRGGMWEEVMDFSTIPGIDNITRLAFSPDGKRLAFVATMKSR